MSDRMAHQSKPQPASPLSSNRGLLRRSAVTQSEMERQQSEPSQLQPPIQPVSRLQPQSDFSQIKVHTAEACPSARMARISQASAPLQAQMAVKLTPAPTYLPAIASPGQAMAKPMAERFGQAFGADFSTVRLHENAVPPHLGAIAFTQGEHIYLRSTSPASKSGQDLLGHELTHVLQQRAGRVPLPQTQGEFNIDSRLEQEANQLGDRAAQGQLVHVPGSKLNRTAGTQLVTPPRQAKFAIALRTDNGVGVAGMTIQSLDIVGRPDRLKFSLQGGGRTEGDHSTAWGVIRLGAVNRLSGCTLAQAVTQLNALVNEAKALPGAQAARVAAMPQERRTALGCAATALRNAATGARNAINADQSNPAVSAIQNYIAAYLKYRNSIGLTVMNSGQVATGDGEYRALQTLQHWEQSWTNAAAPTNDQKTTIVEAMGTLFSKLVWDNAGAGTSDTLPGKKDTGTTADTTASIQSALRSQHEGSLNSAYPNLWGRLTLVEKAAIVPGTAWIGNHIPLMAVLANTGKSWAVQIWLGNNGRISGVSSAGRSAHGMGNSEGSHTTSYGLFERALNRLIGKTLAQAKAILDQIKDIFRALPGAKPARADRMSPERVRLFGVAKTALTNATANATTAATVSTIQSYAEALLYFRNTMGLVTIHAGGVPGNKQEQTHLSMLDGIEDQIANYSSKVKRANLIDAIAGLFDRSTLTRYEDNPGKNEAPGQKLNEDLESVFKPLYVQHIQTIKAAYPFIFSTLDVDILADIAEQMSGDNITGDVTDATDLITIDGSRSGRVGANRPSAKRAKKADDPDY